MENKKLYAERCPFELSEYFAAHMYAMTAESLHDKADIALELAYRDSQIEAMEVAVAQFAEEAKLVREEKTKIEKTTGERIAVLEKALRKCAAVLGGEAMTKAELETALRLAVDALKQTESVCYTCKTCKHWDRDIKGLERELGLGICRAVPTFWDSTYWDDGGRRVLKDGVTTTAFARDDSDYCARLITTQDHRCPMHVNTITVSESNNG